VERASEQHFDVLSGEELPAVVTAVVVVVVVVMV